MSKNTYFAAGLDVGQTADPSALAVVRKQGEARAAVFTLMALRRYELRTAYRDVIDDAHRVMTANPLKGSPLGIDQTGVGRPVVELAQEKFGEGEACIVPITITGGNATTEQPDGWHVSKRELVTTLALVHQSRRLIVPWKLRHGRTLAREMENFRSKITLSANEQFEAWRAGQHDDLLLACAIAVFCGERFCGEPWEPPAGSHRDRSIISRAPKGVFEHSAAEDDEEYAAFNRDMMGGDDPAGDGGGSIWDRSF